MVTARTPSPIDAVLPEYIYLHESTGESYKISNDYRSHYARLIMRNEQDLNGIFEIRELTAA